MKNVVVVVGVLGLVLLGCGGGDGPAKSTCETLTARICQLSCDCRPAKGDLDRCYVQDGTQTSGRNPLPCAASLGRDVCGDTTKAATLFDACLGGIEAAECVPESASRIPLRLPAACMGLLECKSGPCLD